MRGTRFAELSAFVAVAELSSFTKAAKQLGISTATLSQTICALDESLGVRLLNRTTRSVSPTDAGERLLAQLRPLLEWFRRGDRVGERASREAGRSSEADHAAACRTVRAAAAAGPVHGAISEITLEISAQSALTDIVAVRCDAGIRVSSRLAEWDFRLPPRNAARLLEGLGATPHIVGQGSWTKLSLPVLPAALRH